MLDSNNKIKGYQVEIYLDEKNYVMSKEYSKEDKAKVVGFTIPSKNDYEE
nr:MAG TPA: hypothetical protein [Caudoviricetes sp.]DAM73464.1 MAG TPA: hypothetical protein [Caudoviricetes sp.]